MKVVKTTNEFIIICMGILTVYFFFCLLSKTCKHNFIYIVMYICFTLFFYMYLSVIANFLVFIAFVITFKISCYIFVTVLQIWWKLNNKWLITYVVIINFIFFFILCSIFLFYVKTFGIKVIFLVAGCFLCFRKWKDDVKFTITIKKTLKPTVELSFRILFLNVLNFLSYFFLLKLVQCNYYDIPIKMGLFLLLAISFIFVTKELYIYMEYYYKGFNKFEIIINKTVAFCWEYPGHAISIAITGVRIIVIMVTELACMRYGIVGGMMMMGGPGIIVYKPDAVVFGGIAKKIADDIPLTEEELVALKQMYYKPEISLMEKEEELRIALQKGSPLPVVEYHLLPKVPEKPSNDLFTFIVDVINNKNAFSSMAKEKEEAYITQFKYFRSTNEIFTLIFPDNFNEFKSAGYAMTMFPLDQNGRAFTVSIPVNEEQTADFIINKLAVQVKNKISLSLGEIKDVPVKYAKVMQDERNNFIVVTFYEKLVHTKDFYEYVVSCRRDFDHQYAIFHRTAQIATQAHVSEIFSYANANKPWIQQTAASIRKIGYLETLVAVEKNKGKQHVAVLNKSIVLPNNIWYPSMSIIRSGLRK